MQRVVLADAKACCVLHVCVCLCFHVYMCVRVGTRVSVRDLQVMYREHILYREYILYRDHILYRHVIPGERREMRQISCPELICRLHTENTLYSLYRDHILYTRGAPRDEAMPRADVLVDPHVHHLI